MLPPDGAVWTPEGKNTGNAAATTVWQSPKSSNISRSRPLATHVSLIFRHLLNRQRTRRWIGDSDSCTFVVISQDVVLSPVFHHHRHSPSSGLTRNQYQNTFRQSNVQRAAILRSLQLFRLVRRLGRRTKLSTRFDMRSGTAEWIWISNISFVDLGKKRECSSNEFTRRESCGRKGI